VAATEKLQIFVTNEADFSPSKQSSNWQHQFTSTSSSATTGKNFIHIAHHLSKL